MKNPYGHEDQPVQKYEKDEVLQRFDQLCRSLSGAGDSRPKFAREWRKDHWLQVPVTLGGRTYGALRAVVNHEPEELDDLKVLILAEDIAQLNTGKSSDTPTFTSEAEVELTMVIGDLNLLDDFEQRTDWDKWATLACYNDLIEQLETRQAEGSIL